MTVLYLSFRSLRRSNIALWSASRASENPLEERQLLEKLGLVISFLLRHVGGVAGVIKEATREVFQELRGLRDPVREEVVRQADDLLLELLEIGLLQVLHFVVLRFRRIFVDYGRIRIRYPARVDLLLQVQAKGLTPSAFRFLSSVVVSHCPSGTAPWRLSPRLRSLRVRTAARICARSGWLLFTAG